MPVTQAVLYRDPDGHEPVDAFIERLRPVAAQVAVDNKIDLLNGLPATAPPLAFPHSSQITGELRELRCHYGRRLIRILYQRSGNLLVLLHALEKRSGRLSTADIKVGQARFADFRTRMNARPKTSPRAAGHDAPSGLR